MPMNRKLYPKDWDAIAFRVKAKANWICQACGRVCRQKGEDGSDFFFRLDPVSRDEFLSKPQRFTLTVSHLNHVPSDCSEGNLRAMCAPCHLDYDKDHHRQNRRKNKALKQQELGQLTLQLGE